MQQHCCLLDPVLNCAAQTISFTDQSQGVAPWPTTFGQPLLTLQEIQGAPQTAVNFVANGDGTQTAVAPIPNAAWWAATVSAGEGDGQVLWFRNDFACLQPAVACVSGAAALKLTRK